MSGKRVREQSGRRTWNLEDYEIRQECIQETKRKQKSVDTEGFELAPLQARQEDLGLDKLVGKCEKVAHDAPKQKQGGFFCQVCDELFKDSQSYLDHVNGKKREFGVSVLWFDSCRHSEVGDGYEASTVFCRCCEGETCSITKEQEERFQFSIGVFYARR